MESEDKKDSMSSIELVMYLMAANGLFSSLIWSLTGAEDKWIWFSRFALGIVCLGLGGIMREIRKSRK
jgi:hypothetical protein